MTLLLFFRPHRYGAAPPAPVNRARRGVTATVTTRHDLQAELTERQTRKATLS